MATSISDGSGIKEGQRRYQRIRRSLVYARSGLQSDDDADELILRAPREIHQNIHDIACGVVKHFQLQKKFGHQTHHLRSLTVSSDRRERDEVLRINSIAGAATHVIPVSSCKDIGVSY